jgi:hypothetical protein
MRGITKTTAGASAGASGDEGTASYGAKQSSSGRCTSINTAEEDQSVVAALQRRANSFPLSALPSNVHANDHEYIVKSRRTHGKGKIRSKWPPSQRFPVIL